MVKVVESKHMAIGLQLSGKTTFAAALWYLLGTAEVPTTLRKGRHSGDHSYIELLATQWADGWEVPRTKLKDHQNITMNLQEVATGADISLQFVDLGGEIFERAFATRMLPTKVADALCGVENLMLFVNAAQKRDDITLIDVAKGIGPNPKSVPDDSAEESKFNPAHTPRQVQLVDFLQSVQELPISMTIKKLVVVISAWDRGPSHGDPHRWLTENMPLLDQYLQNTPIELRVYGVSGQGGDLPDKNTPAKPKDRLKLLELANASDRIQIVGYDASKSDLTHPIRWLSGLEGE